MQLALIEGKAQTTLDALFSRAAFRAPSHYALIDAPNRKTFADGAQRRVTYAAADRVVSGIAGRLHRLGLPRNSVAGLQFANMAESVLALLGVWRAGMIAAPLPLLWRRAEIVAALSRVGAKAIIAGGRVGAEDLSEVSLHVAAELFPVRYVCGFGAKLPDGVVALDELFTADRLDPMPHLSRGECPGSEIAVVTFDKSADRPEGHIAVARTHAQLIAAGAAVMLEGRISEGAKLLAMQSFGSFAGLASTLVPWLLSGGTLHLHQAFNVEVFAEQCAEHGCDSVVLPGPLVAPLNNAGLLAQRELRNVIAMWRSPERTAGAPAWRHPGVELTDVQVFGETGLIAARRGDAGQPEAFGIGAIKIPHDAADGALSVEVSRSETGTLLLRGPMVPRDPFLPDGEEPALTADAAGYVDSGYPCRIERDSRALVLTGPPAGIINVGGYRLVQRSIQDLLGQNRKDATLAALPDPLLSYRLAGRAIDRGAVQRALTADGVNALVVGAFGDRRKPQAA